MQTLGIDLAAQAKGTAACLITWATTTATVEFIEVGVTDDRLLELLPQADKAGIDVPLGWPNLFVEAVYAHRDFSLAGCLNYQTSLSRDRPLCASGDPRERP